MVYGKPYNLRYGKIAETFSIVAAADIKKNFIYPFDNIRIILSSDSFFILSSNKK